MSALMPMPLTRMMTTLRRNKRRGGFAANPPTTPGGGAEGGLTLRLRSAIVTNVVRPKWEQGSRRANGVPDFAAHPLACEGFIPTRPPESFPISV